MQIFTEFNYALEEAEFSFKQTGKAQSVIDLGEGEFTVYETDRAVKVFKLSCILETIRELQLPLL